MQVEVLETIVPRIIEKLRNGLREKSLRKNAPEPYSQSHICAESWSLNIISYLLVFVAIAAFNFSSESVQ